MSFDIKRFWACSTISQISYSLFGIGAMTHEPAFQVILAALALWLGLFPGPLLHLLNMVLIPV